MGLDINGTRLLLHAKASGVEFARTATIGRQGLHLSASDLAANLAHHDYPEAEEQARRMKGGVFAEPFLRLLGAETADSFDASSYEGATHIHDMNQPIREEFKGRYTVVLDGGSLEHIFNYPTAIKNCMEMTAIGGHFMAITPTNNFMGHGFYQFSPELFFPFLLKRTASKCPKLFFLKISLARPGRTYPILRLWVGE